MLVKGGAKKSNPEKTGFKPVEDMIKSIGTDFRILTADSLFGFMVVMDVSPDNSEYLGLTSGRKKMSKPITTYLLKLAVISETADYMEPAIRLPDGSPPFFKSSETASNLYKEAKIQQKLWLDSIIGGKIPVCPDVYAFSIDMGDSMFGGKNTTSSFKSKNELKFANCYDFLREKSRYKHTKHSASEPGPYAIGAIAMEYIPNSRILHDVINDRDESYINEVCVFAGAQVLRLFLKHSILHHDLHSGNILVNEGMAFIIDFGIVLDIENLTERERFTLNNEIGNIVDIRDQFIKNISEVRHNYANKQRLCENIFTMLRRIEMILTRRFQMSRLFDELFSRHLHTDVVDKYFELTESESTSMSRAFIDKLNKQDDIEMIYDANLELAQTLPIRSDAATIPMSNTNSMPQTIPMPQTNSMPPATTDNTAKD